MGCAGGKQRKAEEKGVLRLHARPQMHVEGWGSIKLCWQGKNRQRKREGRRRGEEERR